MTVLRCLKFLMMLEMSFDTISASTVGDEKQTYVKRFRKLKPFGIARRGLCIVYLLLRGGWREVCTPACLKFLIAVIERR